MPVQSYPFGEQHDAGGTRCSCAQTQYLIELYLWSLFEPCMLGEYSFHTMYFGVLMTLHVH